MILRNILLTGILLPALYSAADIPVLSQETLSDFMSRKAEFADTDIFSIFDTELSPERKACLTMLYAYMPLPDMTDRSARYYLDYVVDPALKAREEMPWGKTVPDRLFFHFVLPVRVNNEALDKHRPVFYDELKNRISGMDMKNAILEINHWCHEKVSYQPSDGRTHSPLQSVSSAIGRCGEESTFTVAAMRAMGIPARQVYTPRWAHTDDNHAWVEVWADGQWFFLGACEPEPVLNLGWFNAPASRGMLMHARVFGKYNGSEEVLAHHQGNTDVNVTEHYAPTDTVCITVLDTNGNACPDINVTFRIYNYAELYPIASKRTDANGTATIVTGKGDMIAWASDGTRFGFSKCSVGQDKNIPVILQYDHSSTLDMNLDLVPPAPGNNITTVDDAARKLNDARLIQEDSIRNRYIASWPDFESLGCNTTPYKEILKKSRGNYSGILKFLNEISLDSVNANKAIRLLQSLSDKDLTDVTLDVLRDHFATPGFGDEIFCSYIMSPRIDLEELTPFRSFLNSVITDAETFRKNPDLWVRWVADNIHADTEWFPAQVTMSPESVWHYRHTSAKSRDIFFVAGARSIGIPSRIDPVTQKVQWFATDTGIWHDAIFTESSTDTMTDTVPKAELKLHFSPTDIISDPRYYTHYTISRITGGEPSLLTYPDFIPWSESFRNGETLDAGQYLITTGQRLADGSVLANLKIIDLRNTNIIDTLAIRQDNSKLQVIGSFNSENRFMPRDASEPQSLLSVTGRGYYVLGLVRPNHEPSDHALRDIAAKKDDLEAIGRQIVLIYNTEHAMQQSGLHHLPALPDNTTVGYDINGNIAAEIAAQFNITEAQYPVFIIADTFNRVVYMSQGYTIGLGQKISDTLLRLK